MEIIRVSDMINEMLQRDENGSFKPFSLTFVTCDILKNRGGEKITFDRALFVGGPSKRITKRNPNHGTHFTRNIRHADSDRIITMHPLLVTRFNGKQITQ